MSEHKRRGRVPKFSEGVLTVADNSRIDVHPVQYSKNIRENPDGTISPVDSTKPAFYSTKPDPTTELKTLLKAIYDAGQLGIRRNLEADLATIQELCA